MRLFASLIASSLLLSTAAFAQAAGGAMTGPSMKGPSMQGPSMQGPAMSGNAMQGNTQAGASIFSHENMAMMIVDRDRSNKGMTPDQVAAARQQEMTKDRAETPQERQARKAKYDSEWMQLTAAEKTDALAKLDAQTKARAMMAAPAGGNK
jgi:pentapeptide MXKDX repeat protein